MTKREAAIISAYTGVVIGDWTDIHSYINEIMCCPIYTHELPALADKIKEKAREDFMKIKVADEIEAYWKPVEHEEYGEWLECTSCNEPADISYDDFDGRGKVRPDQSQYCPICGAKMLGLKQP